MMDSRSKTGVDAAHYRMQVIDDLGEIRMEDWARLQAASAPGACNPFVDFRFLNALAQSGSIGDASGWSPRFILLERGETLVAAAPLFEKQHSYGEYVFDWAWADAYRRNGLPYYPTGLVAVPFTPVPGPRLLAIDAEARAALARALIVAAEQMEWSSVHVLFPDAADSVALASQSMLERKGVQFHWQNPGYRSFDEFLSHLTQPKRKKLLAERRKVSEAGIRMKALTGREITEADWDFFYRCYAMTYAQHHSTPYLERAFFSLLGQSMPDNLVMFIAEQGGRRRRVAASLLLHDSQAIYGRYWGAVEYISCLHFEASYYAPMEWAIEQKLVRFEGGAQGEHKMARGFLPVQTSSFHWLAHPAFNDAIARYLERESGGIDNYLDELRERSPLREPPSGVTAATEEKPGA
jgi:predicted N-acyltransferase